MSDCCAPTFTGGGTAGNVTRLNREQIESIPPTPTAPPDACDRCAPRAAFFQQTRQPHSLLAVSRQTSCPIRTVPTASTSGAICPGAVPPPTTLGTGRGWSSERTHPRVSRIEHVAAVTHRSSGLTTARIRDSIQNATTVRGAEFIRRRPAPPPCPTPHGPQPGVPIAPQLPCNPGNQRVDFQSPYR